MSAVCLGPATWAQAQVLSDSNVISSQTLSRGLYAPLAGAPWQIRTQTLREDLTPLQRENPLGNSPYFVPNDPLYSSQWHLANGSGYPNINVAPAWAQGITGSGVTIGIVDDGLQHAHPDLSPNYDSANSWDFGQGDSDPNPVYSNSSATVHDGDNHGTSVAGIAAARGGNSLGVTGVAPLANLAGLRLDFDTSTSADFAAATLYHSDGVGPMGSAIQVKNHSYGISTPLVEVPAEAAALKTSAANGTIHVFAAGNERFYHGGYFYDVNHDMMFTPDVDLAIDADANKKHTQSLSEVITVAALGSNGKFASYSDFGANVFVTAPSNGSTLSITTTDRTGGGLSGGYNDSAGAGTDSDALADLNYTSIFGGTSAAAPVITGVMALGKQVNPNLDVRMAKHLLANTSTIVDPTDASAIGGGDGSTSGSAWVTNAAGHAFNMNYGFGLVNADAFTAAAGMYSGVTPLVTETSPLFVVGDAIPDDGVFALGELFAMSTPGEIEDVELFLDITHPWRGELNAYLQSPAGTLNRLMTVNPVDSFDDLQWTLTSNAFWGEDPVGLWTLYLFDPYTGNAGTLNSFSLAIHTGSLIAVPEPGSLALAAVGLLGLAMARRRQRKTAPTTSPIGAA